MLNVIEKLRDQGYAMIIVTHEMRFARSLSTRVVFMDRGRIVAEGPPDHVFDHCDSDRLRSFLKTYRGEMAIG